MIFQQRADPQLFFFFFNDTATTEIYTLSLHDALPILSLRALLWASFRRWPRARPACYVTLNEGPGVCRGPLFFVWRGIFLALTRWTCARALLHTVYGLYGAPPDSPHAISAIAH